MPVEAPVISVNLPIDRPLYSVHALVSIEGARARLRDLRSTNGTFVAEKRIEETMLENRDHFRVGSHEVAIVVTENEDDNDA
jgi:pSer/pThr/pTyr-binding forkhead associated (FHA) protein